MKSHLNSQIALSEDTVLPWQFYLSAGLSHCSCTTYGESIKQRSNKAKVLSWLSVQMLCCDTILVWAWALWRTRTEIVKWFSTAFTWYSVLLVIYCRYVLCLEKCSKKIHINVKYKIEAVVHFAWRCNTFIIDLILKATFLVHMRSLYFQPHYIETLTNEKMIAYHVNSDTNFCKMYSN